MKDVVALGVVIVEHGEITLERSTRGMKRFQKVKKMLTTKSDRDDQARQLYTRRG